MQLIDVSIPSSPTAVGSASDGSNGFTALAGACGVDVFVIGSSTYTIVASNDDNGVQLIDISTPSSPTAVGSASDGSNGFTMLNSPQDVDTFVIGSNTYAIVASRWGNGVQLIDVSTPSSPTAVGSASDDANGFTELYSPRGVNTFVVGSNTYAIVASYEDKGVQVIDVSIPSNPVAAGAANNDVGGFTALNGANSVDNFRSRQLQLRNCHGQQRESCAADRCERSADHHCSCDVLL